MRTLPIALSPCFTLDKKTNHPNAVNRAKLNVDGDGEIHGDIMEKIKWSGQNPERVTFLGWLNIT